MKFCNEAVDPVAWTATNDMVYYNLPAQMVQHYTNVHEFNGTLVDIIKFLARDFKVRHWPLNPTAPSYDATAKANPSTKTTETKITSEHRCENVGWTTVSGRYRPKKQRSFSWDIGYENRYDILTDHDDDFQPNDMEIINHTDKENKAKKEFVAKISLKENKTEILDDKYDIELVTNDALTALLQSLNEDQVIAQQESHKIIQKLKYDIVIKKNKLKEELKTVSLLNEHYKHQIQKSANEKREHEKKHSSMKSKVTEMEAQMLLFQDTLAQNDELQRKNDQYQDQKDELQRLCDQYLLKIQDHQEKMREKDTEISKLTKEHEIDQATLEKLKEQNEQLDFRVRHADLLPLHKQKEYCELLRDLEKEKEQKRKSSRFKKR